MREGSSILTEICLHKKQEVEERMDRVPFDEMLKRAEAMPPPRDFLAALHQPPCGPVALIAEVKKASPSAGVIRPDFDPVQIARTYEENGAACLSVLTDEKYFQGHDDFLGAARAAVAIPVLRKDFTLYPYQIYEARALGADAVLLIAALFSEIDIFRMLDHIDSVNMTALVEVHTELELKVALRAMSVRRGRNIIGINSRDLNTFVTDLGTVERLAAMVPAERLAALVPHGVTLVAESGIKTPADVRRVAEAGAQAVLVGETLMRAPDIGAAVRELMGAG
jgi:indole-3-glycerol phosphate synthase